MYDPINLVRAIYIFSKNQLTHVMINRKLIHTILNRNVFQMDAHIKERGFKTNRNIEKPGISEEICFTWITLIDPVVRPDFGSSRIKSSRET